MHADRYVRDAVLVTQSVEAAEMQGALNALAQVYISLLSRWVLRCLCALDSRSYRCRCITGFGAYVSARLHARAAESFDNFAHAGRSAAAAVHFEIVTFSTIKRNGGAGDQVQSCKGRDEALIGNPLPAE